MLAIDVEVALGAFALDVRLEVPVPGVTVVAGESGAGKTTLLRAVAGLVRPARGRIALDGEPWLDVARGVFLPPERRAVAWVPQDYGLFPHLSAFENVAFGLRATGVRGHALARPVEEALARFGVGALRDRRPGAMSGGQQQRVALARALVLAPRVLLLDEPLASLDVATRRRVRGELRRTLEELPCATLLVSHAPGDALALGNLIAVLEDGRLIQVGTPAELAAAPASEHVAEFLGIAEAPPRS